MEDPLVPAIQALELAIQSREVELERMRNSLAQLVGRPPTIRGHRKPPSGRGWASPRRPGNGWPRSEEPEGTTRHRRCNP